MIQIRNITAPVARLVARARALDARATNDGASPAERIVARRECEALCETKDLAVVRMSVPAPYGEFRMSGTSDTILTEGGVQWWRGQLALVSAMHAGFGAPKERPWEADGKSFYLLLVGTKHAVWKAHMYYATAEAVAFAYMDYAPYGRIDEYLCGVSLAIGLAFETAYGRDQAKLDKVSRKALTLWQEPEPERPPPPDNQIPMQLGAGELNLMETAQDPWHPVRRGFDLAKREKAGERVLDELKRPKRRPAMLPGVRVVEQDDE